MEIRIHNVYFNVNINGTFLIHTEDALTASIFYKHGDDLSFVLQVDRAEIDDRFVKIGSFPKWDDCLKFIQNYKA